MGKEKVGDFKCEAKKTENCNPDNRERVQFSIPYATDSVIIEHRVQHAREGSNEILTEQTLKKYGSVHYLRENKDDKNGGKNPQTVCIPSQEIIMLMPRGDVCKQRKETRRERKALQDTSVYGQCQVDKLSLVWTKPRGGSH